MVGKEDGEATGCCLKCVSVLVNRQMSHRGAFLDCFLTTTQLPQCARTESRGRAGVRNRMLPCAVGQGFYTLSMIYLIYCALYSDEAHLPVCRTGNFLCTKQLESELLRKLLMLRRHRQRNKDENNIEYKIKIKRSSKCCV